MESMPQLFLQITDPSGNGPLLSTHTPRKFVIQTYFGAGKERCWLELYNEDAHTPFHLGQMLIIHINDTLCFQGRIRQIRMDSVDDHLSLYAEHNPDEDWNRPIAASFTDQTIPAMIQALVADTPLTVQSMPAAPVRFQQIQFGQCSLFTALDFLAKIAGNWYWDLSPSGTLFFRRAGPTPDHWISLREDAYTLNIWETHTDRPAGVVLHGGIRDGTVYEKFIPLAANIKPIQTVYVRFDASLDVYAALERAIQRQMQTPSYEHYVDLHGQGETISPGTTFAFTHTPLPYLPPGAVFRIKARTITYAHETYETRFYLTSGLESTPTYFYYFKRDVTTQRLYWLGRVGPFQLDVSALDSPAHLDADLAA